MCWSVRWFVPVRALNAHSWFRKSTFKHYMQKLLRTGSELLDRFPCVLHIYLAWTVHLMVHCVFLLSRNVSLRLLPVVIRSLTKKREEENRVVSSAPLHLTCMKIYWGGTARVPTAMRTGEAKWQGERYKRALLFSPCLLLPSVLFPLVCVMCFGYQKYVARGAHITTSLRNSSWWGTGEGMRQGKTFSPSCLCVMYHCVARQRSL